MRDLVHETACYAEVCAAGIISDGLDDPVHDLWQSRWFERQGKAKRFSPAIAAAIGHLELRENRVGFVSLLDPEPVVALRLLLEYSGLSIGAVRSGLSDRDFVRLTTAEGAICRSGMNILSPGSTSFGAGAQSLLNRFVPDLLVVEGLSSSGTLFGDGFWSDLSDLILSCATRGSGLLLFD